MRQKHTSWPLIILSVVAAMLFWQTALAAKTGNILGIEETVLRAIYEFPFGLRPVMLVITLFGSTLFFALLLAILFFLKKSRLLLEVFLTGSLTYILVQLAKFVIDRPRPAALLSDIQSRELFVDGLGFPSGHVALATAMSLTLLPYLPKQWCWLPLLWIPAVGLSRVYLGVHAPLDIVGGFAVGVFVVAIQQLIVRKYRTHLERL